MAGRKKTGDREHWTRIAVGGACNNRCVFCGVSGAFELPLQQLMTLVAKAYQAGTGGLHLAGGEVTTRRDLKVLLRFLKRSDLPWSVETNARLFSLPEWARAFADAGLVRALVGLHGPQPVHDRVTGDASFEQTTEGVRNLLAAGVEVDGRCVLTRVLVESAAPEEFAVLLAGFPQVTFTLTPPAPPERFGCDPLAAAPDLGALRDWMARFSLAVADAGVAFCVHGVPHCILPEATARVAAMATVRTGSISDGPPVGLSAWPCRTCARATECPGFVSDYWPAGSIDFLAPDSERHPGHLVLRQHGLPLRFDLGACPFKADRRPLGRFRGETWLAESDGGWSRWLPENPVTNEVRLDTLVTWGQSFSLGSDGRPVPLSVAPQCLACHRLHECPACLVPAATRRGRSLLPIPLEAWRHDAEGGADVLDHTWTGALPAWARTAAKGGPPPRDRLSGDSPHPDVAPATILLRPSGYEGQVDHRPSTIDSPRLLLAQRAETAKGLTQVLKDCLSGSVLLAAPVREAWLLDPGVAMPRRAFPVDPVRWLRTWRRDAPTQPPPRGEAAVSTAYPNLVVEEGQWAGLVPVRYDLPSSERRGPFVVELTGASRADPVLARPHRGISLQVTEACMCRCIMCNIVGYFKTPMMPLPRILRTLTEAGLLGIGLVDLFGGEVTLRKDLFALLDQVRWLGMDSMFITTGYYVDRAFVRRLAAAGVKRVVVSIDGSRSEIHDPIRQLPGLWERAVKAMRALAAEPSIEAFASTVILSQNLADLPALIRLSAKCGIRKHEFFLPISGPVSSTLPRWPAPDEAARFLDEILPEMTTVASDRDVTIDFRPEVRSWPTDRQRTLEQISSGQYNVHQQPGGKSRARAGKAKGRLPETAGGADTLVCQAPGFNLFVTVNGNVYPCDMPALISRDTALGNLADAGLAELVSGDRMRDFLAHAGHHPGCRMCVGRYEAVR